MRMNEESSSLRRGDRVRLKQPFSPTRNGLDRYHFGIVAGVTQTQLEAGNFTITGVIVYLYDPQTLMKYQDEMQNKALFYFKRDEVEPC